MRPPRFTRGNKKEFVIARQRSCRGNPIICYSPMFKWDSSLLRSSEQQLRCWFMTDPIIMKREQRGESREKRDYNLLSNWLRFFTKLLSPHSSLLFLLGNTKKDVIARQRSCRGNPIICYSQMFKWDPSSLHSSGQQLRCRFMTDPAPKVNYAKVYTFYPV